MDQEEIKGEERSADEAEKHGNDDHPWIIQMEEKLASKSKQCQPSHPFTICKVPLDIREVDSVAHDPLVVSIGPYHRGCKRLLDMEQVKWRNLNAFRRRAGKDFNEYLKAMKQIEPRARACYSGNIDMEADEFIEMMLLDGLFMIKLFSTRGNYCNIFKEEPIYTIRGMLERVARDMLLLENQLPSFVLEGLWNVFFSDQEGSRFDLWSSAGTFILDSSVLFNLEWDHHEWDPKLLRVLFDEEQEKEKKTKKKKEENPAEMINEDGVHHLLHLVYLLLKPAKPTDLSFLSQLIRKTLSDLSFISPFIKKILSYHSLISRFIEKILTDLYSIARFIKKILSYLSFISRFILSHLSFLCPSMSKDGQEVIPSAVELHEAGVVFKCVKAENFFDVKFERGTMKMPRLLVQDSTKPLLRNFIAYEQCFPDQGEHITTYCSFMDFLVNTRGDVEILKKSNIIENCLGSDKDVALLFNDLVKGTFVSDLGQSYHGKSFKDVLKHTQKTWPKWRARLKHDYFSNPWAIISLIAATFVIFLTSVQTYKAAFP